MPSNIINMMDADTPERDPTRSKGKGKAKDEEPEEEEDVEEEEEDDDDDDDDDDDGEGEEEEDEEEEGMEEINLENIQPRRTRGKRVDYTSPEALKKAGLVDVVPDDEMQL